MPICFELDVHQVTYLLLAYYFLYSLAERYPKRHILVSNLISSASCWKFVFTQDLSSLISYYWYDLILMTYHRSWLYVSHHVVTLYFLMHCEDSPDYENLILLSWTMKASDLLIHHYKITDAMELDLYYPRATKIYQLITTSITILAWVALRCVATLMVMPVNVPVNNFILPAFVLVNMWWVVKMCSLVKKIWQDLKLSKFHHVV